MSAPNTVIVSGPPGVGKTACIDTLCSLGSPGELDQSELQGHLAELRNTFVESDNLSDFVNVQQVTTRAERLNAMNSGEPDGKRHISTEKFLELSRQGLIVAGWRNQSGNYYGFDRNELLATTKRMEPHQILLLEVNPLNPNLQELFNDHTLVKNCGWLGFSASHSYTLTQAIARDQGIPGYEYDNVESFLKLPKIQAQLRDGGYSTQFDSPDAAYRLLQDVAQATRYDMEGFNSAYYAYMNKMRELKDKGKMHRMVEFSWKDRGRIFDTVADTVESLVRHPRTPEGGITVQQLAAGDREAVLSARFNWHRENSNNRRDHSHRLPSEGDNAVARILQKKITNLQAEGHWHDVQEAGGGGGMPARWRR